ncbi:hypothetical protein [Acinetobacter sp. NS-4]|uniref:beta strand repeat-containing protein n=1 Tax=Acinetobacter sp. NS-4 TaxID=3127956 RepID=UPI00307D4E86
MSNQTQRLKFTQLAASIALVAGSATFISSAHAEAPTAGTNISNVASATYTDSTGASKQVNSNIVTTTVSPVGSLTLVANRTATANANALVSLSHTLTNKGNDTDTFALTLVDVANGSSGDDYDFSGRKIYLDTNNDGTPDGAPITSVTLAAGQAVNLIVEGTTEATATAGKVGKWTLTATSGRTDVATGGTLTASNTDTVTIINGAVISLTKSASVSLIDATKSADTDREVTYTLVYKNTGNSVATNVAVTDVLDAKLAYVAGSAQLMGVAKTDADADSDNYKFVSNTLTLNIPSLAPNTTGTLTFKARVVQDTDVGLIKNTAEVQIGTDPKTPSNDNYVEVAKVFKGTINDSDINPYADGANPGASLDNQITIPDLLQGQVAVFGTAATEKIVIHNTGNFADEFTVSTSNGTLPTNSVITLYQADGVTPFVSTGTIAKGGKYELVAKITLPASYANAANPNLTATLLVKPKSNPTQTADTLDLIIAKVTPATVDLHNGDGTATGGTGTGVGTGKDTGQYVDIKSVLPSQPATFPLQVDNLGAVSDNFNLSHNLPAGWDVKFYIADAAGTGPTGSPITNTGNINASTGLPAQTDNKLKLVAVVTPPLGETAGDKDVRFTVSSPATNLSDTISEKLTVQADRKLVLNQDRIGQVAPGGTIVYKHTLTNNSNLIEGESGIPFALTGVAGWATSLYIDNNNDGNIDVLDTLVTGSALTISGGIAKGTTVNLLVKVQAPTNATVGTQNPVVLTFSPVVYNTITHPVLTNTDLTTVTEGQVRLVKDQYLANCATGAAVNGAYTQGTVNAKPGECVKYRIVATNEGNATVTNVVVSDNTPSYTTLKAIDTVSPKASNATLGGISADGATGTVSATQPSLAPNENAALEFVIKVNN